MVPSARLAERASLLEARDTSLAAILDGLNAKALRAAVWLSPVCAALYAVAASRTRTPALWALTAGALLVWLVAVDRLRHPTPSIHPILVIAALSLPVAAAVMPDAVRGALWTTLVTFVATAGLIVPAAFVRRTYTTIGAVAIGGPLTWVMLDLATWGEAAATAAITSAALGFAAVAVTSARTALERSESIRLDIFRRVPIGLFRTAPDGRIVDANPALARILGYESSEDLRGLPPTAIYVDRREQTDLYRRLDRTHSAERFAHRLRRRDGETIWVRGFAQTVRDPAGEVLYVEGSIEDVTQRREIERISKLNEQRFRTVFDRAPIALWEEDWTAVAERIQALKASGVADIHGHLSADPSEVAHLVSLVRFLDVNPAGIALVGAISKQQAMDVAAPATLTPEVAAGYIEQFVAVADGRDHLEIEIEARTAGGSTADCRLSWAAASSDGTVDLSRVVVAITDVSAIKQAERELARLVESKDELVASVSHELRTPIATIMGMALELRDHGAEFADGERAELMHLIADQSRELSDIVEDLLIASRSEGETLVIRPEVLDLHSETVRVAESLSGRRSIAIAKPEGPVLAWADPLRSRQILRNLLTNAVRYGGDHISVSMGRKSGAARVRICDDGPGVPPAECREIFEPYHRSRESGLPGSIGLGLPVSRRLARMMGGDLTYTRTTETVFELTLPIPGNGPSGLR